LLALAPFLLSAALGTTSLSAQQQVYDLVLRGGRVLDGTGNPWYRADVAVLGDRVAAVGDLSDARAHREIDATGLYLAPGFIDVHSHAGSGLDEPDLGGALPLLTQGVTTVFVNPDGGGAVDMAEQRRELLANHPAINVAQMVPHGSVRRAVIGMADRAPSDAELDRMRGLVREGMEQGAFGLSTGPWYAPGSYSTTEELVELAKVAAEYGGAYSSHIRDEADFNIGLVAAVDEVIRIAREAQLPSVITHLKALGPRVWGFSGALVHRIDRAREQGLQVYADQYPYTASGTSLSGALVPRWALAGGDSALQRRIGEPAERARLRAGIVENLDRRGGAARLQFRRFRPDPTIEGRTIQWYADREGLDAPDAVIELLTRGGASVVSFNMADADVETLMRQPWMMTSSDGGLVPMGEGVPHPRSYGSHPRKIRLYVGEKGVIDLAMAIRSMTSLPAQVFQVRDRGMIRPGAYADLAVFDLERVNDPATFQEPHQLAEGMVYVLVNGRLVVDGERFTDERPGRVLDRQEGAAHASRGQE
jgi:N-acyl-D-aspartate/D-glutamate deacylase